MNLVFFLLGDSPASEFYMPTYQNTVCSVFIGGVSRKNIQDIGVFTGEKVWLKRILTGKGAGPSRTSCGGQQPQLEGRVSMWRRNGLVSERGRGAMRWQISNCCISGGCLLSLSPCRRGFQDLLKISPSSLFMLCGHTSIQWLPKWVGPCVCFLQKEILYPVV